MEGIQLDFLCLPGQIGDMQFERATINYTESGGWQGGDGGHKCKKMDLTYLAWSKGSPIRIFSRTVPWKIQACWQNVRKCPISCDGALKKVHLKGKWAGQKTNVTVM